MNRLENLRATIDHILFQLDGEPCRNGFVHLYGVSAFAALLAHKHGLDEELAAVSGMLHDISTYVSGSSIEHARKSAAMAQRILAEVGSFSMDEIHKVVQAITRHSDKGAIDSPFDEVLKDADVLYYLFYNPCNPRGPGNPVEHDRFARSMAELGISHPDL